MESVFISWAISATVIIFVMGIIGKKSKLNNVLAIFIDFRGRFSLTRFQISMWTLIIVSLLSGVFFARLFGGVESPLDITIPNQLLILMGISVGSTVASEAIKAEKDKRSTARVVKASRDDGARFAQVYLAEEGTAGEEGAVDITKFQNYLFTLIVLIAYVAAAIAVIAKTSVSCLDFLPGLGGTMLTLIGISHAGYIAGKLPDQK
ncbi:hypothetical protein ACFLR7_03620 [Acidobacteriota bacterium]